jgi:mono/diheme cytochrome c family protein
LRRSFDILTKQPRNTALGVFLLQISVHIFFSKINFSAMYTGLLHSHKLFVTLFLLHYVVKTVLLFVNADKAALYTKKTKIPDMIISFGFLATGLGLFFGMAEPGKPLFLFKLASVIASIPLAVIGFKKKNKILALAALALIFSAYGMGEMSKKQLPQSAKNAVNPPANVQELYAQNCQTCHGADGTAGLSGAKNLQTSVMGDEEVKNLISAGKNNMPPYQKSLSEKQIDELVNFVKTLRK